MRGSDRVPRARWLPVWTALAVIAGACTSGSTGPTAPIVYTAPPTAIVFATPAPSVAPSTEDELVTAPPGFATPAPSVAPSASSVVGQPKPGQVLFGLAPGPDICSVTNPLTVFRASQPVYFAAVLKDQMDGSQDIVLHITLNGATLTDRTEPANGTAFDCYGNREPLASLAPGAYRFQILLGSTIEADGSLTVT